jgi:hypothetical protein
MHSSELKHSVSLKGQCRPNSSKSVITANHVSFATTIVPTENSTKLSTNYCSFSFAIIATLFETEQFALEVADFATHNFTTQ